MTKTNHSPNKQHHEAAPSGRPILNEKVEDAIMTKRRDQDEKSALHNYSVQDKRKDARIEHTNGSTPRRDR
jgi:hypothetical protein